MPLTATEKAVITEGKAWIDTHADDLIGLLEDLVSRPALSGQEGIHRDQSTPVGRLFEFLKQQAGDEIEISTQRITNDYVTEPRENVYATISSVGSQTGGLACTSHTDIVPAGDHDDWPDADPFRLTEATATYRGDTEITLEINGETYDRDIREKMAKIWKKRDAETVDVLIGRGAFDNKAAIVCLVGSLLGLEQGVTTQQLSLLGDVVHGHLVDEEVYQIGVKRMVGWKDGADWFGNRYDPAGFSAVVLEGSYGFVPVIGHRGLIWVVLEAEGASAHASTPELGHNAVVGLSKAIVASKDPVAKTRFTEPFVSDDYLGEMTVAPGTTFAGGDIETVDAETRSVKRSGLNSVPDWAEATYDFRIPRWKGFPEGVDTITDLVCERVEAVATNAAPDTEFTAHVPEENYFPPVALADSECAARSHPLVKTGRQAAESTFGYTPHVDIAPGVTDAAFLYHGTRIPTLVEYGPAGGLSHEPLEYVEQDQVIAGAKAMLEFTVREVGVTDTTS